MVDITAPMMTIVTPIDTTSSMREKPAALFRRFTMARFFMMVI